MKRIIYLTILYILLLPGCSKPSTDPTAGPEQFDRYIFFSQNVKTKASLIEDADDMNGKSFGVVGFKYEGVWTDYDIKDEETGTVTGNSLTPNVFYDENSNLVNVETVNIEDNSTSYAPLQGWSNSKKYSFFAYYPIDNPYVSLVNDYNSGVPSVQYTNFLIISSENQDPVVNTNMVDVMTAGVKDLSSDDTDIAPDGEIELLFNHRLASLGVSMKNSSTAEIQITSLSLTISGIRHSSTIIPLDGGQQTPDAVPVPEVLFTMTLNDDEKTVGPDPIEIDDKLIFVPQSEDISISIAIEYTREYSGSEAYNDHSLVTGLNTSLFEGKKHLLKLDFTDYNVYVMVINGNWESDVEVDHEFN